VAAPDVPALRAVCEALATLAADLVAQLAEASGTTPDEVIARERDRQLRNEDVF
jgi:hypothetical protein